MEKSTNPARPHTFFINPDEKDILVEDDNEFYLPIFGKKVRNHFIENNKKRREDTKKGIIHIGNISGGCTRASMLTEKYAEFVEPTIWDCTDFMDGNGSEGAIVEVLNSGRKNLDEKGEQQKHIVFDDFQGHPDYIDDEEEVLFELKSSKKIKPFILSEDSIKGYIRQIVYYMVLNNMENGRILVRYGLPMFPKYLKVPVIIKSQIEGVEPEDNLYKLDYHRDTGQFPFYTIKLTLKKDSKSIERIKKGLLEVIKPLYQSGDITKIPVLDDKPTNWKCNKYCKIKKYCDETPDLQTDPATRYVLLNKHIDEATNKVRRFGRRKDKDVVID